MPSWNWTSSHRFLSPAMVLMLVGVALFAISFDRVDVNNDGTLYYAFLRRLLGANDFAIAYQFGSAFWNGPFYLVALALAAAAGPGHGYHYGEISVAVASGAAAGLILYVGWRILRELDLPRGPVVLLLTLFGTPLFYYVFFQPSYKHAADTLYATAAFWFVLRAVRDSRRRWALAAGVCFALLLTTRYANAALLAGVVVTFGMARAWRSLWWTATTTVVVGALLYSIPLARGIPYREGPNRSFNIQNLGAPSSVDSPAGAQLASVRVALAPRVLGSGIASSDATLKHVHLDVTAPPRMLLTLHRGLFVWTPLTAFATLGFALLLRRSRRDRAFLVGLGCAAFCLVAIHVLWGNLWDGGFSFSQRFLTALFPFFLIGAAELVRRGRLWTALLAVCVVWSTWLGLVHMNGYWGQSAQDGVVQIVENYTGPRDHPPPYDSLGNFAREMRLRIEDRWTLLWHAAT